MSAAYQLWRTVRATQLDEIEAAHGALGGHGRGRRWATQQINHAYTVLLCSQFQGFCRDLYTECMDRLVLSVSPDILGRMLREELTRGRRLDRGNPTPEHVEADFKRFAMDFWNDVVGYDPRNAARRDKLLALCRWRNAIAHQDFTRRQLEPTDVTLSSVRSWRRACRGLAFSFDHVLSDHILSITRDTL